MPHFYTRKDFMPIGAYKARESLDSQAITCFTGEFASAAPPQHTLHQRAYPHHRMQHSALGDLSVLHSLSQHLGHFLGRFKGNLMQQMTDDSSPSKVSYPVCANPFLLAV
eukprot:862576-Pelagomonas_calceolata.AAC.3